MLVQDICRRDASALYLVELRVALFVEGARAVLRPSSARLDHFHPTPPCTMQFLGTPEKVPSSIQSEQERIVSKRHADSHRGASGSRPRTGAATVYATSLWCTFESAHMAHSHLIWNFSSHRLRFWKRLQSPWSTYLCVLWSR